MGFHGTPYSFEIAYALLLFVAEAVGLWAEKGSFPRPFRCAKRNVHSPIADNLLVRIKFEEAICTPTCRVSQS